MTLPITPTLTPTPTNKALARGPDRCPYCNAPKSKLTARGARRKKLESVRLFRCHACGRTFTPGPAATATALNILAELYGERGRFAEAELLHKKCLAIRERMLGPGHPLVAQSLNNLAILYRIQSRTDEAEQLYKKSLAIR